MKNKLIRLDDEQFEKLKKIALQEKRTVNNLIGVLLNKALRHIHTEPKKDII